MKLEDVKKIAKERGLKVGKGSKTDLIRNIQQGEGNNDCFNTNYSDACGQHQCLWRGDCR